MTVPEGYFDGLTAQIMSRLPEQPAVVQPKRRTPWQIIRPYVYMAAMFAGIWLMMNMFTLFRGDSITSGSAMFADLLNDSDSEYVSDYIAGISSYDLYNDLYDEGFDIPDNI